MGPTNRGVDGGAFVWQIDVLRFAFAALVVVGHAAGLVAEMHPGWRVWPFDRFASGGLWVAGFFVLSGWCIERSCRGHDETDVSAYLLARVTRVLPLYLWFLTIVVVVETVIAEIGHRPAMWELHALNLLWQATMLQGILDPFGAYNASWSLTHELLCYVAWGVCLGFVSPARRRLVAFAATFALLVPGLVLHVLVGTRGSYTLVTLPLYFSFWLLGNLAAADPRPGMAARERRIALGVLAAAGGGAVGNLFVRFAGDTVWMVFFSLALSAALRLSTATDRARPVTPWVIAVARWAGLSSYPIYLGHGIVLIAFGTWLNVYDLWPSPEFLLPALIAVAIVGAILLGLVAEVRSLAWRASFLRSRGRIATGSAA